MSESWATVFAHPSHAACAERALVLTSLEIAHDVLERDGRYELVVPQVAAERAKFELWQYEQENRPKQTRGPKIVPQLHDPLPGVLCYIGTIGLVAWLAGNAAFGFDWLASGRIDGRSLREGEWWRTFTALTLHLNVRHLIGNMGFGALFGYFAARLIGNGVSWLVIVLSAAMANGLNAFLLDPSHRSIGASTAVFAALGAVSGFVWRGRLMAQDRWPFRWGPIVGGIALLAFTGTGSENTDVGAHLMGFVCGLIAGMLLVDTTGMLQRKPLQMYCGALAIGALAGSWFVALT